MFVGITFVFVAMGILQVIVGKGDDDSSKITFPGPINDSDLENRIGIVNETNPCKDLTFCTIKPPNYPQEHYNKLMRGKFIEPIFQPKPIILNENGTMFEDRVGDPAYVNNCETTSKFEPLYTVRSENGEWRNVIQAAKENFLQTVRIEMCQEASTPCFVEFKAPPNIKPMCMQTYNAWEFLVDDNKGGSEKIHVDLPVCCTCRYTDTEN